MCAFTLAEVLITLGIIGVVAVLTLPNVINETKNREYDAARKRMVSTVGEAVRIISVNGDIRDAVDAKDFVQNHLSKNISIVKTCENDNLRDCGIETDENKIYDLNDAKMTMPKTFNELAPGMSNGKYLDETSTSYGFVMANGYAVNLFYNPNCISDNKIDSYHPVHDMVCVNVVYDINGLRVPNQVGKDIGFITILYPGIETKAVAPLPYEKNATSGKFADIGQSCANFDSKARVPDRDELASMYFNSNLLGILRRASAVYYWSASKADDNQAWRLAVNGGHRAKWAVSSNFAVRCVK